MGILSEITSILVKEKEGKIKSIPLFVCGCNTPHKCIALYSVMELVETMKLMTQQNVQIFIFFGYGDDAIGQHLSNNIQKIMYKWYCIWVLIYV